MGHLRNPVGFRTDQGRKAECGWRRLDPGGVDWGRGLPDAGPWQKAFGLR